MFFVTVFTVQVSLLLMHITLCQSVLFVLAYLDDMHLYPFNNFDTVDWAVARACGL